MSAARFRPGERVRVRQAAPPGHIRTPWYIRGHEGEVERVCGFYANPEELAFNRHGLPKRALYRVRFPQKAVWPDYDGPARDTLEVEIYEHWLEEA